MRRFLTAVLVAPLAALTIAACGDDDSDSASATATDAAATTTVVPTETAPAADVPARARELARETRELQEEVTASARSLVSGSGDTREQARKRLAGQEDRARELAEAARTELGADAAARDALVKANERTASAAKSLGEFAENQQQDALKQARSALAQGEKDLRGAADDLLDQAPADARKALEDAVKKLPSIP